MRFFLHKYNTQIWQRPLRSLVVVLFLVAGGINQAFAQHAISGTVKDSNGLPLISATIKVKGTNAGTLSDKNGAFTINLPAGKTVLTVTYVGYEQLEVNTASPNFSSAIVLKESASLNEVVVVGYTKEKRTSITGSVSIVDVGEMKTLPSGNAIQALQGQASGVTIVGNGMPGEGSSIEIRGVNSFGDNTPLYIIDGVQGNMQDINMNDIESVQVLKDAGSAAVYGVRGSNGVIIVTTKKGKTGKVSFNYDGYYGVTEPLGGNPFHTLNTPQLAQLEWTADRNSGQVGANGNPVSAQYGNGVNPVIPDYILPSGAFEGDPRVNPALYNISDYINSNGTAPLYQIVKANKTGTDWFHAVFKPALNESNTFSASSGSDKSTSYFSLSYLNEQGTLMDTYLKRYALRANNTFNLTKSVRVGENAYWTYKENPQIANNSTNSIYETMLSQPIIPIYDIMGNYAGTAGQELGASGNPVAQQQRTANNKSYAWNILGNVWGEVDFLKHFTARTSFGGTYQNGFNQSFSPIVYESFQNTKNNSFSQSSFYSTDWTWTNSLSYANVFNKVHSLKVFVASEAVSDYGTTLGGTRIDYPFTDPSYLTLNTGNATGQTNYGYLLMDQTLYSLIAKADYAYNDKYLISGTVRRDQSSLFGSNSQTGIFPSVSAGWRIAKEAFMSGVSWVDDLKLRGSYGILGNKNNVGPNNAYTLFSSSPGWGAGSVGSYYDINGTGNSAVAGFYPSQLGNSNTGWEKDRISNIGVDAILFHSKLDVTIELYDKKISGLLFPDQAPIYVTGAATVPEINIGDIENKGIDISATYHLNLNQFKFNIGGTFTSFDNKVVSIPGAAGYFDADYTLGGSFARNGVGHPVGEFFGYQIIGLFKNAADVANSPTQTDGAPGRFKYKDVNGDGKIDPSDRTFLGNPNPTFTYGLNLNGSYKNFDLGLVFYGSYGNKVVNFTKYYTDFYGSGPSNKSINALDNSWTPSNLNATTPITETAFTTSNGAAPSSYYVEDGSFLKLKSAILGYTGTSAFFNKAGITKFRVYVQGTNLFTLTKYTGLDPEVQSGVDGGGYYPSNQRGFLVGANLTF
jgi:TonB-linked SusC/RagA family outer membrane protein